MAGALDDIRVLDLSEGVAGPFCTKLLAGLGAEVIKVEQPVQGDPARSVGPFLRDQPHLEGSALFTHLNTNKKSVSLNLQDRADRKLVRELARISDVVVESFKPGDMSGLGLGYDVLSETNPGVVMTSITNFGQRGPWSHYEGTELTSLATSGILSVTGDPDREPLKSYGYQAHYMAGLQAAFATLAALHLARETGEGQTVDVSVQESAAMYLATGDVWNFFFPGQVPRRAGSRASTAVIRQVYSGNILPCKDGYVWFGTGHNQEMIALLVDAPELDSVELWRRPASHAEEIDRACQRWLAGQTKEEAARLGQELRIAVAPVQDLEEVARDPQHQSREFFQPIDHPGANQVKVPGPPFKASETPWSTQRPPQLGEHNQQLICELLGYGPHQNTSLRQEASDPKPERLATRRRQAAPTVGGPLEGTRVLDLTEHVAGPVATTLLRSMGAEVIKVERPWLADLREMRFLVPSNLPGSPDRPWNRVPAFNQLNRGKRGFALDLARAEGVSVFKELVTTSDVVIDNFSPRVMRNFGLDYGELKRLRPDIIAVSISGYGATGPLQNWVASGPAIDATCGIAHLTGYTGGPPVRPCNYNVDFVSGVYAAFAISAALMFRRRTGTGQYIDLAMKEAMTHFIGEAVVKQLVDEKSPERDGNNSERMAPHGCFPCQGEDAWIALAVRTDDEWGALRDLMGDPLLFREGRFTHAVGRCENRDEIHELLAQWTSGQDKFALMDALQGRGIPAGAVLDTAEMLANPHLRERGYYESVEHAEVGIASFPRFGWILSKSPCGVPVPAPLYGEANEYVIRQLLGTAPSAMADLLEAGTITGEPRQH